MPIPPEFITYALEFSTYKYLLIFVGTIIEGPILMIACGFFLSLGVFDFFPLYIAIIAGDLVGDAIWYAIGRNFLNSFLTRFGKYFGVTTVLLAKVELLFKKHQATILFLSKITMGFGAALGILMVAGAMKIPFKKFLMMNFLGEIVLVGILLFLGYFLGNAYNMLSDNLKYYFIAGVICVIPLSLYLMNRYLKTKIIDSGSLL